MPTVDVIPPKGGGNSGIRRKPWLLALQAAVSIALLAGIFWRGDFRGNLAKVLLSASPFWLLCGFALAGVVQFLCLVRWRIFLRMVGMEVGWAESAGCFFAGLFCNLFLPGGAGGDFVKIGLLAARRHDPARAALSVVMDRFTGSISMIVLGLALMAWKHEWLLRSPQVAGVVQAILIYLCGLAVIILLSVALCSRGLVGRLPAGWPCRKKVIELSGAYFQCAVQWRRTLVAVGVSLGMLALFFLTYYFAARAYGVGLPAGDFLAIMPTVDIISGLPVSLGGFGVREGLFVFLLGQLGGVPAAVAVSVSLCGYMLSAVWALPGAGLWFLRGRKAP